MKVSEFLREAGDYIAHPSRWTQSRRSDGYLRRCALGSLDLIEQRHGSERNIVMVRDEAERLLEETCFGMYRSNVVCTNDSYDGHPRIMKAFRKAYMAAKTTENMELVKSVSVVNRKIQVANAAMQASEDELVVAGD